MAEDFKDILKKKMDKYIHFVYKITKDFPKEELYGSASQLRRSALSVILNYIEGFARRKKLVQLNFLEISYGSLKESKYLLFFALSENWITRSMYLEGLLLAESIGGMLWTEIIHLDKALHGEF